jgi:hypothetical protein
MTRYTGPPMDLDNMRSLGVTKIDVYCACDQQRRRPEIRV